MRSAHLIDWLFTGRVQPLAREGHAPVPSGIVKHPRTGLVRLSFNGLEDDEQGDQVFHGGPEKAVHHYPGEHYAFWRSCYPQCAVPLAPGAFGENLSTTGMTERSVCIGDIYQSGTVLLQVSQGRQPCWKLNRRLGQPDAALSMQMSGATGWYYRVLRDGWLGRHDPLELVERPCPDWPLQRLIAALFPQGAVTPALLEEWRQASLITPLSANWRATFCRRVESQQIEDWTRRLHESS